MSRMSTLSVRGHKQEPVPNSFRSQPSGSNHLAVMLPGLGYTCQMPLLYYPAEMLYAAGADVLMVEYDYRDLWQEGQLSMADKARRLFDDAMAAARAGLAQGDYSRLTLVGKSLGTLAVTHLLEAGLPLDPQACIYLTPLLQDAQRKSRVIRACPHKLFVIGTADRHYDPTLFPQVIEAVQGEALIIDGADHSLEIEGNVPASIDALKEMMEAIRQVL